MRAGARVCVRRPAEVFMYVRIARLPGSTRRDSLDSSGGSAKSALSGELFISPVYLRGRSST